MHTQLFHCSATMYGVKPFLYVQVHLIQSVTIRSLNHVRSINVNVIKKTIDFAFIIFQTVYSV